VTAAEPLHRALTLRLAEETLATHPDHGGRCRDCRTAWPCEAYGRANAAIAALTRPAPAIGRAQVHPRWIVGASSECELRRPGAEYAG